jgi:alpha-mannosidase
MKDSRRRPIGPIERIQQNVNFLLSSVVVQRQPIGDWQIRQGRYRSPGNYDFASDWAPYSPDTEWGGEDVTAVFRTRVRIPQPMDRMPVWIYLSPGGEGILRVDGHPVYGFDFNHRDYRLTACATAGAACLLELECYYRDAPDDAIRNDIRIFHRFRDAELRVMDAELESVYYDFQVALDAAASLPEDSEQAQAILLALQRAMALFDPYASSRQEARRQILEAASQLRKSLYDQGHFRPPGLIHLVGHCHIDLYYTWPCRESVRKNLRTNLIVADLAERYAAPVFAQSQARLFSDMKQFHPDVYERIRHLVAAGRYEVVGGMWVEPDANLPSGESLVRQILYGRAFFHREFANNSTVCWMPDVFGVCGSLPQILVDGGYRLFYTNKQAIWHDTNEFPHDTFWWEGIDGTKIVAHIPPTHFVGKMDPHTLREQWSDYRQKQEAPHVLYTYGFGDGGGGPTPRMIECAARLSRMDGMPGLSFGSAESFADTLLKSAHDLPVWADELYLEAHRGVQTTKGVLKRKNRLAEAGLRAMEILETAADWLSHSRTGSAAANESLWKILLECQFHDAVTGSHCTEAGQEIDRQYDRLIAEVRSRQVRAQHLLASHTAPDRATVFNLSTAATAGHLEWDGAAGTTLADSRGPAPCQRLSDGTTLVWLDRLPSLGHQVFEVRSATGAGAAVFEQNEHQMVSPFYQLNFDSEGRIAGLLDMENKRQVLAAPGNRFALFEDLPGRFEAWDIAKDYEHRQIPMARFIGSETAEHGPLMASRRFRWQIGASLLTQEIRLYAHSRRVDFCTHVHWQEERKLLRVYFPFAVHCTSATYEIAFGNIRRCTRPVSPFDTAKFEVPFQRWFDVAEHGYGVALLNNGRYGGCVRDSVASLSLLKAPKFPDPTSDLGEHEFTYSLLPHRDDWRSAGVLAEAVLLNAPLQYAKGASAVPRMQYVDVTPAGVSVECLKPAEDGDGWILRLVDCHGQGGRFVVRLPFAPASVESCSILEGPKRLPVTLDGDSFSFDGRPFGIFTFRIRISPSS